MEQQAQDDPSIAVLKALAWGPPVGTLGAGHRSAGASELVARGWLERSSDSAGRTRFILPREVGLALRGGAWSARRWWPRAVTIWTCWPRRPSLPRPPVTRRRWFA
ncbi:hypothetical protein [Actinomyces sp. 432]|uniref:hypothetical protein n=1 Tax=Actinomyces sp. 432 TaxID=2057798 RepID=UPI001F1607CE|nr:hypothetical protein [Actinomyces sp. 432]